VSQSPNTGPSRRDVLKATGGAVAASALAGVGIPLVHAAESHTVQLALVGCGGRGTGAAENALLVKNGPTKLVAMADVFPDRLNNSYRSLEDRAKVGKDQPKTGEGSKGSDAVKGKGRRGRAPEEPLTGSVDVPQERRFLGFDAYKHAMDCLKPGDVVILATPPAFRWPMFQYAIQKGLNVFMEKPVSVDGPSSRKMFALAAESEKKNLKVGVGLMCRHCAVRQELHDRIKDGQVGDVLLMRAYRVAGPTAKEAAEPKPENRSHLAHQIRMFHSFLWAAGGSFSDFLIHNIDECSWMKDAFPIKALGMGGRHYRGNAVDQNFDVYSTEYTYADGTKLYMEGRTILGCYQDHSSYLHGSKCAAVISERGHSPARCRIFKGQNFVDSDVVWRWGDPRTEPNPYQLEWEHLIDAIRNDKPYNEAKRGTEASLVTAMGRMACHTGQLITRDQMLNCEHEFAPNVDKLKSIDDEAPVLPDRDGKYPVPEPGRKKDREY
jgi:predicted dehydrogenase